MLVTTMVVLLLAVVLVLVLPIKLPLPLRLAVAGTDLIAAMIVFVAWRQTKP